MKSSSLLTTIVTATVLLTGCFKNSSEGCSSCAHHDDDVMTEQMQCATCPSADMIAEEPEINITVDENAPEMNMIVEEIEEEK